MENNPSILLESFVGMLNTTKEPLVVIIKSHLYTEYWIDVIIKDRTKNPSKIFRWSYANKLEFIYNLNVIPTELYQNLLKLNQLRNQCAHNLNFDFTSISHDDYNFWNLDEVMRRGISVDGLFSANIIGYVSYGWLDSYARKNLGLKEKPINE